MFKKIAFWVGVTLIVVTHVYMLAAGLPAAQMTAHAVVNLVAAGLIVLAKA